MGKQSITSLVDLLQFIEKTRVAYDDSLDIWWRGQSDSRWKLVPGVFRPGRDPGTEKDLTARFRKGARTRQLNCPSDDDLAGWLYLMQHYRLPTRLLDWTESPLIATFFAVAGAQAQDATLWALEPFALNESQTKRSTVFGPDTKGVKELFEAAFRSKPPAEDKIFAISTKELDIRMLVQLSSFTIHGSTKAIEDLRGATTFLRGITIPATAKPKIYQELSALGIRLPNLFPDLEHLANYLSGEEFRI